ncbi:MAG: GatB/YqeY domain-containing protein [Chloroflexota bacterium]
MADYKDKMMAALKDAMKNKDKERRDTIRLLQAAISHEEIEKRKDLPEGVEAELTTEEELDVLVREAKKRRESIAELESADRDTADEERELEIIESFLPAQMSEEEIRALAKQTIEAVGATEMRDMGKVMGKLSTETKGKADGKLVSTIVREMLQS